MVMQDFTTQTKALIDNLKGVCTSYGLGNDGNEFKMSCVLPKIESPLKPKLVESPFSKFDLSLENSALFAPSLFLDLALIHVNLPPISPPSLIFLSL